MFIKTETRRHCVINDSTVSST